MKQITFFLLLSVWFFTASAQEQKHELALRMDSSVVYADKSVEVNIPMAYTHSMELSSDSTSLFTLSRIYKKNQQPTDKLVLVCRDAATLEEKWTQNITMKDSPRLGVVNDKLTISSNRECIVLDASTGSILWKQKMMPVYVNAECGIIAGYKSQTSSKLLGFNMSTAEKLWETNMPRTTRWGWNNVINVDSTRIIIVADDINMLDIATGDLKSIKAKTGVSDTKSILLQSLVAVAAGVATAGLSGGTYYAYPAYYGVDYNMITELTSNILYHDSLYYMSDRNRLICFDSDMKIHWEAEFESKTASHAQLAIKDGKLFMLNFGYGMKAGTPKKCGKPFVALFDTKNGARLDFLPLSEKKEIIRGGVAMDYKMHLLLDDKISTVDFSGDSLTYSETVWDTQFYGQAYRWITSDVFAAHENDANLTPLSFSDGNYLLFVGKKDSAQLLVLNDKYEIKDSFPSGKCYNIFSRRNDYMFIGNSRGEFWVTHSVGLPIAQRTCGKVKSLKYVNDTIYIFADETIYSIAEEKLMR